MFDAKRFAAATLSYMVITFGIAYPVHFVWFHDVVESLGMYNRAEPIIALGVLSMLVQGAVMAYLYPYYDRGGHPLWQGIRYGLLMGLMVYTVSTWANAAKIEVSSLSVFMVFQTLFHTAQFVLSGAAIGLIYRRRA